MMSDMTEEHPENPDRRLALSSIATLGTFGFSAAAQADTVKARAPDTNRTNEPNASHPSPADQPGVASRPVVKTQSDIFYRPTLHFSPVTGFMNDPNGLLFDGTLYHLYYQFDPFAPYAGRVHWGHATSTDLLHWKDQPIAIPETKDGEAYSGCAVLDTKNASGLFEGDKGGILALYTRASPTRQAQYLAASHDGGLTFTE